MRKILLFTAAFILAIISMPLFFGLLTEHRIHTAIEQANLPEGMVVQVKSYDRGYLTSHALVNITMLDATAPAEPSPTSNPMLSFNVEGNIQHGPFFKVENLGYHVGLAHIHGYINAKDLAMANTELAKIINDIFSSKEIVSADAILNLLGAFKIHVYSSAANFHSEGDSVNWGGVEGIISVSSNNNAIKSSFDISPMLLQSNDRSTLDFSKISLMSDAKRDSGMPWVGQQSLSIPSFYIRNDSADELRFSNLIVNASSDIKNQLASAHLDAKADNLQILSQPIKDSQLLINIDKLDAKSFMDFSEITQNNNLNTLNDDQRKALTQSIVTMLAPGALIDFQHDMSIAEGPVNTKLILQFPTLPKTEEKESLEVLSHKLFTEITASLSMQAPTKWLETSLYNLAVSDLPPDAPAVVDPETKVKMSAQEALQHNINTQLQNLHQVGVLVEQGTQSAFQLNYDNGVVSLNGKKLTQDDIIRLLSLFK